MRNFFVCVTLLFSCLVFPDNLMACEDGCKDCKECVEKSEILKGVKEPCKILIGDDFVVLYDFEEKDLDLSLPETKKLCKDIFIKLGLTEEENDISFIENAVLVRGDNRCCKKKSPQ